jgi:hypothetical protein
MTELGALGVQIRDRTPDADWQAAGDEVQKDIQAQDLVTIAPDWASPVARQHLSTSVATANRIARADESRFARAFELSIRGGRDETLAGWSVVSRRRFGKVTLSVYANPNYRPVQDDLVDLVREGSMTLTRIDDSSEEPCPLMHLTSMSGNIGFGPGIPADRFACTRRGGFAGITILPDLTYRPRRCIYVPPQGGSSLQRLEFPKVHFGSQLVGHHGIAVHAERDLVGTPVTLVFRVRDQVLGRFVHADGEGWASFEMDTSTLKDREEPLSVEVSSPNPQNRHYCFEATTR